MVESEGENGKFTATTADESHDDDVMQVGRQKSRLPPYTSAGAWLAVVQLVQFDAVSYSVWAAAEETTDSLSRHVDTCT
ncbi:hypothetical protein TgHK011_002224 [Trichoderma gracile]|nr:hypothetical protein TgHK011_002224 [Trichoderma gracile]